MTIPVMDTSQFRLKLAGLVDEGAVPAGAAGAGYLTEFRDASARLGCVLAHLFGEGLEELTKWSRIGTAISTAVAKCADGDIDRLVSLMLDHVRADAGQAAACAPLLQLLAYRDRPESWRQQFVRYLGGNLYAVLTHARARWQLVKSKGADL